MCGPESPGGKDCCNDWVCRLSQMDMTRYCMENINIPYMDGYMDPYMG